MKDIKSVNPKDLIGLTKVPLDLLPLVPQAHTSLALLEGACKYGRWNWRDNAVAASVYVAAAKRHLEKWANGRDKDAQSGIHELGHAAACLFIVMDAEAVGNLIDDRVKDESVAVLLDELQREVVRILASHGKVAAPTPTPSVYDPIIDLEEVVTDPSGVPIFGYGSEPDDF